MNETELKILMIIVLVIGALCPGLPSRHERFIRDKWSTYSGNPKASLILPKYIRKRFHLADNPVDLVTYLHYVTDYYIRICFGVLILPCVLLKVRQFAIIFAVFLIIAVLADAPEAVLAWRSIWKGKPENSHKAPSSPKQKRERESRAKNRLYDAIGPFWKQIRKNEKGRGKTAYIPQKNLDFIQRRIFPKYEEYLEYEIAEIRTNKRVLRVFAKIDREVIYEKEIRR